jgi:hypothetical protein
VVNFSLPPQPSGVSRQPLERLGQQFIVEDRPGAGSNIATEAAVRAPPDGYTLLEITVANAIGATLYDRLSFNFIRDIAAVAAISRGGLVMVVNPSFPASTVREFIAYAKARAYLRHFRIWLTFPSVFEVRTGSYVICKSGAEANDTLATRIADAAVPQAVRSSLQKRGTELLACDVAIRIVTRIELWARSHVMKFGFEIRQVLTHLNRRFEDAAFGDLFGPVKNGLLNRGLN